MNSKHLFDSIECDKQNLQIMIDMLPRVKTKGESRKLIATIKMLVKEVHNTKVLLDHKIWYSDEKVCLPLFECEPSPINTLEMFKDMDSFFGELQ